MEGVARRFIAEIAAAPGCVCTPPDTLDGAGGAWAGHDAAKAALQVVMQAQIALFRGRPAGPAAGALAISSAGPGPAIDLTGALAAAEADAEMDGADDDAEDGDDAEDED